MFLFQPPQYPHSRDYSYDLFRGVPNPIVPKPPLPGLTPKPPKEEEGLAFLLSPGGRENTGSPVLAVPSPALPSPKPEDPELPKSDDVPLDEGVAELIFPLETVDCLLPLVSFAVCDVPFPQPGWPNRLVVLLSFPITPLPREGDLATLIFLALGEGVRLTPDGSVVALWAELFRSVRLLHSILLGALTWMTILFMGHCKFELRLESRWGVWRS